MLLSVIISNINIKVKFFDFYQDLFEFVQNVALDVFFNYGAYEHRFICII